jgi:hypothetical protein
MLTRVDNACPTKSVRKEKNAAHKTSILRNKHIHTGQFRTPDATAKPTGMKQNHQRECAARSHGYCTISTVGSVTGHTRFFLVCRNCLNSKDFFRASRTTNYIILMNLRSKWYSNVSLGGTGVYGRRRKLSPTNCTTIRRRAGNKRKR